VLLHLLQNTEQSERKKKRRNKGRLLVGLGQEVGRCTAARKAIKRENAFSCGGWAGGIEGRTGSVLGKWFIYVFIYIYSAPTI
jgi:hypothetical protein